MVIEMTSLTVDNYSTGYSGKEVLHNINFHISTPGIYIVLGENGSGKTTLFRAITDLLKPFKGKISFNGMPIQDSKVRISYLGHNDAIPVGMNVFRVMKFFAALENVGNDVLESVIERFGLRDILGKQYNELSRGQKKRVSLAKSLLVTGDIMILDEPTSNLDPSVSSMIRNLIKEESRDRIILYSSHNLYEAMDLGSYVLALRGGNLDYFGDLKGLSVRNYKIGIRADGIEKCDLRYKREGNFYVFDVESPEKTSELIASLVAQGIRIYEVKDMSNPLESFYEKK